MTFLLLAIFCLFGGAQAEDPFFKNLEGKEPALKQRILEKRIFFDSELENSLTTKKNIVEYLKLPTPSDAKKLEFVLQTLSNTKNKNFVDTAFFAIFESVGAETLFENRDQIIGFLTPDQAKKYDKEFIVYLFDGNDVDTYLKNKQAIIEMGRRYANTNDEKIAEHLFTLAYRLNLETIANQYVQKIKGLIEKKWLVRNIYCYFLVSREQSQEAEDCFSKIPNVWGPLGKLYSQKVRGGKQPDITSQFENLRGQFKSVKPRLIVYEYFLTENLSQASMQKVQNVNWDYQNGFLIVMLNRKYKKIPKPVIQKIQSHIVQNNPNGYLTQVLQGKQPTSKLKTWFGEKSIFNQSVR